MPLPGGTSKIGLGFEFSARDLASGPIGLLRGNFQRLQQGVVGGAPRIMAGFSMVAAGLGGLSAGVAGFRRAWQFAEAAGEFDRTMAAVGTIARATSEQFDDLGNAAIEAGIRTQYSPLEAAQGLRVLSQQGLIAADSISALVPTLDFASAGMIEVNEAAEVGMGVMNSYGMSVEQLPQIYDRLMRGTQMSALSAGEFITVMGRAASSGKVFGTALDDVIITLGSVRSAGIPAEVATTAVSEAMRRITTDRGAIRTLRSLGVAVEDQAGNLRSVIDISRDFQAATEGMTEARKTQLAADVFGVRGLRTFNAMANIQARVMRDGRQVTLQGAEAIAYYRQQLQESAGTTAEFRTRQLATFEGQMILLRGTVETFRTVFGRTFGVLFRPIVLAVTEGINRLTNAWRNLSEGTRRTIGIIFLVAAALAIVLGGFLTVAGAITLLISVLGPLMATFGVVAAGIVAAIIPVILAIGGLIAVGYALYRAYRENLGGLGDFIDDWVGRVTLTWRALTELFSQGYFSDAVNQEMSRAENAGIRPFVMALRDLWTRAREIWIGFRDAFARVWTMMAPVFGELRAAFQNLLSEINNAFGGLIDSANAIPHERFRSFGELLAHVAGVGLRGFVQGLTALIRAGIGVWRVIQAIWSIIRPFYELGELLRVNVLVPLWRILIEVARAFSRIGEAISPIRWLFRGIQAIGRRGEAPIEPEVPVVREDPFRHFVYERQQQEQDERTEASTARPAAAEAQGRMDVIDEIERVMAAPRARGETRVQNRVTLELDRRQMASVIQELGIDTATREGGVVTDEHGFAQSVWE